MNITHFFHLTLQKKIRKTNSHIFIENHSERATVEDRKNFNNTQGSMPMPEVHANKSTPKFLNLFSTNFMKETVYYVGLPKKNHLKPADEHDFLES